MPTTDSRGHLAAEVRPSETERTAPDSRFTRGLLFGLLVSAVFFYGPFAILWAVTR